MPALDYFVLGGGPAGSAFAILAARAGASVGIIERSDYSRPRPGEHLAGRIRRALDVLQIPVKGSNGLVARSPGILSAWNSAVPVAKPYLASGQADALSVVRHRFDAGLFHAARAAGAETLMRAKLLRAERSVRGSWSIVVATASGEPRAMRARAIVDASGRGATFARTNGALRVNHGDLFAIVGWLESGDPSPRAHALLTVESCALGWWSLSSGPEGRLVATLYTSLRMMKAAGAAPKSWWSLALETTQVVRRMVRDSCARLAAAAVHPACPSRSTRIVGRGWIAIGEAAIAFDPLSGQGVALAIETAFRAFEAARVDPRWDRLGVDYREALMDRYARHIGGRAAVYNEASTVLPEMFFAHAVRTGRGQAADRPADLGN